MVHTPAYFSYYPDAQHGSWYFNNPYLCPGGDNVQTNENHWHRCRVPTYF
jgi:hypothetical protein